ncbi:MAG TPA: hypothetical protein VK386_01470 [Acidimicrobiales bacterium]|nr:hypothetical protein [Acidimicrobiales bacterium]
MDSTAQAVTWSYTYDPVTEGIATPDCHTTTYTYDTTGNVLTKQTRWAG